MSIIRKLKYQIEFTVFYAVYLIFRAMPLEWASRLSGWGWRTIAPRTRRHARAIANLRAAFPDKSIEECDRIARDMWTNLGQTFGEFFHLRDIFDSDRIDASGGEAHRDLFDGSRPCVFCAAHLANWEIIAMGPMRLGAGLSGVYQPLSNPLVDKFCHKLRAPWYPGGLVAKGPAAAAHLLRDLRRGASIGILSDLREGTGAMVPFFGRPAPSLTFPARAALHYNAPLVAGFIERKPGVRFVASLEVIDIPRTGDMEADVIAGTAALQAAFERAIRAHPEQWMWAHRRWG
jgi:Kdo2-lipid IVA lauroyltransferase/acyltransferase